MSEKSGAVQFLSSAKGAVSPSRPNFLWSVAHSSSQHWPIAECAAAEERERAALRRRLTIGRKAIQQIAETAIEHWLTDRDWRYWLAEASRRTGENALLRDERDDLRRRLGAEAEERRRLTAMLTDDRSKKRRSWWPWS